MKRYRLREQCLLGFAAVLVLYALFGMVRLYWLAPETLSQCSTKDRISMSTTVDPAIEDYDNNVIDGSYAALGRILSADGTLLWSPATAAGEAYYSLTGGRYESARRYLLTAYADQLQTKWKLFTGLKCGDQVPTLTLTLQSRLQESLYQYMSEQGVIGSCVLVQADTGEMLAAVSTPGTTEEIESQVGPNNLTEGQLLNRCVEQTAPGSTNKLLILLLAAHQGIALEEQQFTCTGSYRLSDGNEVHCTAEDNSLCAHGSETMSEALANSCNTAFAALLEQLDLEQAAQDLRSLDYRVNGEGSALTTLGALRRYRSTFTLNGTWDFQTVWQMIGEQSAVCPIDSVYLTACLAEGSQGAAPHLVAGEELTLAEDSPLLEDALLGQVRAIWVDAFRQGNREEYGAAEYEGLTAAKTGSVTAPSTGNLVQKNLTGFLEDGELGTLAFYITVENWKTTEGTLAVLPRDIAGYLVTLLGDRGEQG